MQEFLQHTLNGLSFGSIYALVALGYTMVYGILTMINFAHSEIYMMGAFVTFYMARFFGLETPSPLNFTFGVLAGALGAGVIGYFVEKFAYKPLRNSPKMNVLITAIGVSILFQFGGQIIFGADPKRFPNLIEDQVLFYLAEMLSKDFFATTSFYASAAHTSGLLDDYFDSRDQLFELIQKYQVGVEVHTLLNGSIAHPGLKKLN
jgi:branched-chain amino acid transport system permease protein